MMLCRLLISRVGLLSCFEVVGGDLYFFFVNFLRKSMYIQPQNLCVLNYISKQKLYPGMLHIMQYNFDNPDTL